VELSVMVLRERAILRIQPEVAVGALRDGGKPVCGDTWGIAFVEGGEADAVESCDAVESGNPEVAIGHLNDSAHNVLRQSGVRIPMGGPELCATWWNENETGNNSRSKGKARPRGMISF